MQGNSLPDDTKTVGPDSEPNWMDLVTAIAGMVVPPKTHEPLRQAMVAALAECSSNPAAALRQLNEMAKEHPEAFRFACLDVCRRLPGTDLARLAAYQLIGNDSMIVILCTPGCLNTAKAAQMLQRLAAFDPLIHLKLCLRVIELLCSGSAPEEIQQRAGHMIALLPGLANPPRVSDLLQLIIKLANHRIRARAAIVLAKIDPNSPALEACLSDPYPRVRADVVEGLWGRSSLHSRMVFEMALADPSQRLGGNPFGS